tara:strand:+ start:193 stop:438 length:246 start_codon:yes stop_codon:yes gene_type:complete
MQLRSGKVVNKTARETEDAARTLLSFCNKENLEKQHPLYQLCVNEKLKKAPAFLQENCSGCLRQIVEESVRRGINIKFETQ